MVHQVPESASRIAPVAKGWPRSYSEPRTKGVRSGLITIHFRTSDLDLDQQPTMKIISLSGAEARGFLPSALFAPKAERDRCVVDKGQLRLSGTTGVRAALKDQGDNYNLPGLSSPRGRRLMECAKGGRDSGN